MEIAILLLLYERTANLDNIFRLISAFQTKGDFALYINVDYSGTEHNYRVRDYVLNNLSDVYVGEIWLANENIGLKNSVKNSVNKILEINDAVIVIEDDLELKEGFFEFIVKALYFYNSNKKVFTISGYSPYFHRIGETLFSRRLATWGWAIWKDRYQEYIRFEESNEIKRHKGFTEMMKLRKGGSDILRLRRLDRRNKISSWAIGFCSFQLLNDMATVYPPVSYAKNVGVDQFATHSNYEITNTEDHTPLVINVINFRHEIEYSKKLIKPYSLVFRIKNRLMTLLNNLKK